MANPDQADSDSDGTGDACDGPSIKKAASLKTHGAAGTLAIDIPLDPVHAVTEPRLGNLLTLEVTFTREIFPADGQLDSEVTVTCGGVAVQPTLALNGRVLTIQTSCASQQCLTATFGGIVDSEGQQLKGIDHIHLGILAGDAKSSGAVNNTDIIMIRLHLGTEVKTSNCREDLNANGKINNTDIVWARGAWGGRVVCP